MVDSPLSSVAVCCVCGAPDFLWVTRVDGAGLGQGLWKTRTVGLAVNVSGAEDPRGLCFPV